MSDPTGFQANQDVVRDYGTTNSNKFDAGHTVEDITYSDTSSEDDQAGVKAIEAIARAWTPLALVAAYIGYALDHSSI